MRRIISLSSDVGDVVVETFLGSGTTAAVAQKLARRWIGCDINKGAIQTTAKRLQGIMLRQAKNAEDRKQGELVESEAPLLPARLAFSTWRVDDYDGEISDVAMSDVPAKKQDLVEGSYRLPAPRPGATGAVKIIDMLREETVMTRKV